MLNEIIDLKRVPELLAISSSPTGGKQIVETHGKYTCMNIWRGTRSEHPFNTGAHATSSGWWGYEGFQVASETHFSTNVGRCFKTISH